MSGPYGRSGRYGDRPYSGNRNVVTEQGGSPHPPKKGLFRHTANQADIPNCRDPTAGTVTGPTEMISFKEDNMFKTEITEMFGIQYPIICGAMMW
ncbi:MAG: hypothetical protein GY849_20380, partial [Deltaproteobacteria bacterium]|nr:hypothetical protein [Deltaproteobacteria bacterium]